MTYTDLGKVLLLPKFGGLPQWAVVGENCPLICVPILNNLKEFYGLYTKKRVLWAGPF